MFMGLNDLGLDALGLDDLGLNDQTNLINIAEKFYIPE